MYEIKVTIQGIAPLLWNRFSEKAQEKMVQRRTGGALTEEERRAELEAKLYKNGSGVYIPSTWIKSSMLGGCQMANLKLGRRGFYAYLQGGVFVKEQEIPTGHETYEFVHERVGRIPPKTGAAALIASPGLKEGWRVGFTLLVVDDNLPEAHVRTALETAGIYKGLGNGRPDFGRFTVAKWERVTIAE